MEGVLHNIPSIAISQVLDFSKGLEDYTLAQKTVKKLVTKIRKEGFPLPKRELLNVNIPYGVADAEIKITYEGYRYYENDAHLHRNPRGMEYYWLGLHPLNFTTRKRGEGMLSDYEAIQSGYISISPIMLDLTAYESMQRVAKWCE
jgi:5'-nucleotidase